MANRHQEPAPRRADSSSSLEACFPADSWILAAEFGWSSYELRTIPYSYGYFYQTGPTLPAQSYSLKAESLIADC
ncbi:hypothetical protein K9N68_30375 [Kovacikia minuta CCNUW1]|uniref:hypothetical protein n=1 Tax=Kovacikia minuta TaxID=2931930 RepID=UPI001CCC1464|nr:hypothetical protein [Kovacikia minuta]UBF25805.1 hypothetical protein K9N68_30375 [Kovacikia minuta CCNUW1]